MNADTRPDLHFAYPWPNSNPVKPQTKYGKAYNFGPHGWLTVKQAATVIGVGKTTLRRRLATGKPLEDLISPKHLNARPHRYAHAYTTRGDSGGFRGIGLGIRLHVRFGENVPTTERVQHMLECSRATAYRIVRSYKDALGLP